jgi:alkylation response protein AidB-like acyl-CoA dehydrogenase
MDFTPQDDHARHRSAAHRWVERHVRPEWVELEHLTGTHHNAELHRLLAAEGLLAAGWPVEYGGSDVDEGYAEAVIEAIGDYGLRLDGWITTWMVLRTLLQVGTDEQKSTIIPAGLRGELVIVLGYTEPGAGSDLAAAQTRAVPDRHEWVIDGAKMFTSTAHAATHVFLLARTSRDRPKHRGLSTFLVPLDAPGVEIQPVRTLGGQRTNATFYSGVRLADSALVGEVDGGWAVMRVAMVYERRAKTGHGRLAMVDRFARWARQAPSDTGGTLLDDDGVAEQLARMAINEKVARLLELRAAWLTRSGCMSGVEGAMARL